MLSCAGVNCARGRQLHGQGRPLTVQTSATRLSQEPFWQAARGCQAKPKKLPHMPWNCFPCAVPSTGTNVSTHVVNRKDIPGNGLKPAGETDTGSRSWHGVPLATAVLHQSGYCYAAPAVQLPLLPVARTPRGTCDSRATAAAKQGQGRALEPMQARRRRPLQDHSLGGSSGWPPQDPSLGSSSRQMLQIMHQGYKTTACPKQRRQQQQCREV